MRHGLLRPPMAGERGGLEGEITLAQLLSEAGYRTVGVGKWHMGENVQSQPQNVGFDEFYGFLTVANIYTEWRDPYFNPDIATKPERQAFVRGIPFSKDLVRAKKGGDDREGARDRHRRRCGNSTSCLPTTRSTS